MSLYLRPALVQAFNFRVAKLRHSLAAEMMAEAAKQFGSIREKTEMQQRQDPDPHNEETGDSSISTDESQVQTGKPKEYGGPTGKEPTRYGDWEKNGRCIDF